MTLSTDDLRQALAQAAEDPHPSDGRRLDGVLTRVHRARRRRAGAVLSGALVAGAALAIGVGSGPGAPHRRAPTPATSTSSATAGSVPTLWGVRDVASKVDGRGAAEPATEFTWPNDASGLVVRCTGADRSVDVTLTPRDRRGSSMTFACIRGDEEWSVHDLSSEVSRIRPGERVRLSAHLEPADTTTLFGVGLLTGRDLIDGSSMAKPPHGFERVASFALSHGFFYSWTGGGIDSSAATHGVSVDSAQVVTEDRSEVRLAVRCSGRSTVVVTGPNSRTLGSLDCPAGRRVTRELSLSMTSSPDQRFEMQLTDADPGALVEVGVSAR